MRLAIISLALALLSACDRAEPANRQPASKPAPKPDPIVAVSLCLVMGSEVESINLWERPTSADAVGVVDRGKIVGHAWAGDQVRAESRTSTSYYVTTEHTGRGWVSKGQVEGECPDEPAASGVVEF